MNDITDRKPTNLDAVALQNSFKKAISILGTRSESYQRCGDAASESIIDWAIKVVSAAANLRCLDDLAEEAYDTALIDYSDDIEDDYDYDSDAYLEDAYEPTFFIATDD